MAAEIVTLLRDDIDALPLEPSRYELPLKDANGARLRWLFIQVNANGRKAFILRYSDAGGKRHAVKVCDFAARTFDPADLLARHDQWRTDPATRPTKSTNAAERAVKQAKAKKAASRPTVETLAKDYLTAIEDERGPDFKKSHREIGRYFRRYLTPRFGTLIAEEITEETVTPRLADIQAKHGDRTADLSHAYLSALLSWAHKKRRIAFNAMRFVPRVGRQKQPHETRTRDLRLSEIPVFWHGVDSMFQPTYKATAKKGAGAKAGIVQRIMRREFAIGLRLLLLLGVRRNELAAAEWSEFDLKAAEWDCPASRTKTGTAFVHPLPKQAVAMLEELKKLTGPGRYVFPKEDKPGEPMRPETLTHALRKARERAAFGDMPDFTVHDLRRTLRTHITRYGCDRDTAERLLNHRVGSRVERAYDRLDHLDAKRAALQSWADAIEGMTTSTQSGIVDIDRARAKKNRGAAGGDNE